MIGIHRNLNSKIEALLEAFPIVAILGSRQAGKTTLAKLLRPGWKYFDLENPTDADAIMHDPGFFFDQNPDNLIIDEAQFIPELFPILRGVIDAQRTKKGRFLITGFSSPELLKQLSETLAGRIAFVELGTMKANEYYQLSLSPLYDLFGEKLSANNLISGPPPLSNHQVQQIWLKGGYPEPMIQLGETMYGQWYENYRETYINRDIAGLFPKLNKASYQRFLLMLSKLAGTILNKRDIARALEVSDKTVHDYLTIASGTYLWRQLRPYERDDIKSLVKMPKGYLRDSGLLHYLLRISTTDDLFTHPIVGYSFEGFVIEEIIKGIQATNVTNWDAYHYRTRNGTEIDLLLEGPFGLLPIEIKQGINVPLKRLTSLRQFIKDHQLPFGLLINQSTEVKWVTPDIIQIPVGWI